MRRLLDVIAFSLVLLSGISAYCADVQVSDIKRRVMEVLVKIPPEDTKRACILKFTVASYNLKSTDGTQLLVNINYKNYGVLREATLVNLPVSFRDPNDLDKLKDDLKNEITSRSCAKNAKEKTGPVEFTKDYRSQSNSSVQSVKSSETLGTK